MPGLNARWPITPEMSGDGELRLAPAPTGVWVILEGRKPKARAQGFSTSAQFRAGSGEQDLFNKLRRA
ncbi:hypothetical protein LNP74_05175 [Klebsiella pneumoniae subsp. pneumoniae]|nr:hypothetical protein [Klebsiella pneumoniae subsp. pneumoniae]